jgi:hypothetical protein
MSQQNKPDWNDLQNEQAYTTTWQTDKIWSALKRMPIYLWVIIFAVFCTLGYVFKLVEDNKANAADQMMLQAYSTIALNVAPMNLQQFIGRATDEQWVHYAKTATERDSDKPIEVVRGIPELMKINGVAEIVNGYVKNKNEQETVITELQDSLDLKIIGKQFYHAVANELACETQEKINHHLDKMFSGNHERASRIKENWIADALNLGAFHTAEGIGMRIDLAKDKQKFETFVKMTELKKQNPKAWDDVLKENKNKQLPQKGIAQ